MSITVTHTGQKAGIAEFWVKLAPLAAPAILAAGHAAACGQGTRTSFYDPDSGPRLAAKNKGRPEHAGMIQVQHSPYPVNIKMSGNHDGEAAVVDIDRRVFVRADGKLTAQVAARIAPSDEVAGVLLTIGDLLSKGYYVNLWVGVDSLRFIVDSAEDATPNPALALMPRLTLAA